MSLQTGIVSQDGQCEADYMKLGEQCVKCDSSFTSKGVQKVVNDSSGNPTIEAAMCTYYPTYNETTSTKTCYKNDTLDVNKTLCQKVFTIN